MQVTSVKVTKISGKGSFKGYAEVVLDNCFVVENIRIFERDGRFMLAFPSRKTKGGKFINVAHPINNETREMITEAVKKCC
ncbi:stage V sporulation protein G [Caldanaerobius fijiensis DSM 17918]|uniref:Stage V sporulation protein G n=1 Tax=Caldanaerobius fijiensis DSM 17918 TaxID=1121256 RepID=A0A1M5F9G2_9THEO|nr:SpoVG family protein [Caldanaerobius fijiensis]SHF87701.1 stage V sporulation protein G [Caldanaerobius fijiensis DSM 17918]